MAIITTTIELTGRINNIKEAGNNSADITNKVLSLTLQESLLIGGIVLNLELLSNNIQEYEPLIYETGIRAIRIALEKEGKKFTTGWKLFYCDQAELYYAENTPVVKIHGMGAFGELDRIEKTRVFFNTRVEVMLRTIAEEHKLNLNTISMKNIGTWYQTKETDWQFLNRIKYEFSPDSAYQNVYLFTDNQDFMVVSINFAAHIIKKFGLGTSDDRIENLKFTLNANAMEKMGGDTLTMRGFDLLQKEIIIIQPTDDLAPVLAKSLAKTIDNSHRIFCSPLQNRELLDKKIKTYWLDTTQKYFGAQLLVLNDVSLRPGNMIEVSAITTDTKSSSMNGKYPIFDIVYTYRAKQSLAGGTIEYPDNLVVHIGCFRRTSNLGEARATGQNFSLVQGDDAYLQTKELTPKTATIFAQELK